MGVETTSISPKYIISGTLANIPTNGAFEGQIYYSTDTNLSYLWTGSTWEKTSTDTKPLNKLIGLNALNILNITAQSSLTAGTNANFERDTYTDADGYLNTIDTGNTTALFDTNKYTNSSTKSISASGNTDVGTSHTINMNAKKDLILTKVSTAKNYNTETFLEGTIEIIQNSVVLASKTVEIPLGSGPSSVSTLFSLSDYSDYIKSSVDGGDFQIVYTRTAGNDNFCVNPGINEDNFLISVTSQGLMGNYDFEFIPPSKLIIQTDTQTIESGFNNFMIVSNEETTGTGNVSYDITFDGTNYQEDLESFTEYTITDAGTSLILKQNLNAGASSGEASASNWGVLLW